jgi:hypothetical protein
MHLHWSQCRPGLPTQLLVTTPTLDLARQQHIEDLRKGIEELRKQNEELRKQNEELRKANPLKKLFCCA